MSSHPNRSSTPAAGIIKVTQKRSAPRVESSSSRQSGLRKPSAAGRASKRYRRDLPDNDARVSAAAHIAEHASSGSSFLSSRPPLRETTPSLVNTCTRRASALIVELALDLVKHYQRLQRDQSIATQHLSILDDMPPTVMARLAPRVMQEAAKIDQDIGLVGAVLLNTFVKPGSTTEFALPSAMSATYNLSTDLMRKLSKCLHLTVLDLSAQGSLKDNQLRAVIANLPHLTTLKLKGCTQVGDLTVHQLAQEPLCGTITHLNLNYTATTTRSLASLISSAWRLETLKLASLGGFTDNAVSRMMDQVVSNMNSPSRLPLAQLTTLKLKRTAISEAGLARLLTHASQLKRLDFSWTAVRSLDVLRLVCASPPATFEKLVLSGLNLRSGSLVQFVKHLGETEDPKLETLKIGSFGAALNAVSFSAEPLTPDIFKKLIHPLGRCRHLTKLSLFGNERLGNHTAVLSEFLSQIGRRCESLDLTNIVRAGSDAKLPAEALAGLIFDESDDEAHVPNLTTLVLDGTRVDDDAAQMLAWCKHLEALHLANARISEDGLKTILQGCPKLVTLDLSGCRGVPVRLRRDAFALLEELGDQED